MEHYATLISTDDLGYLLLTDNKGVPLLHGHDGTINQWNMFPFVTKVTVLDELITLFEPEGMKWFKRLKEMYIEYMTTKQVLKIEVELDETPVVIFAVQMKAGIKKYVTAKAVWLDENNEDVEE
jgi:hypothetical protein